MNRFAALSAFVLLAGAGLTMAAHSCPFCGVSGSTLTQEASNAGLIIYGLPKNAQLSPNNPGHGTTDIEIEVVIKSHALIDGKKSVTVPKYIPQVDPKKPM